MQQHWQNATENTKPQAYQRNRKKTNTSDEKPKKRRGGDLGEVVEEGIRVEVEEHVREEETQGETQTTKGLGFPQHL